MNIANIWNQSSEELLQYHETQLLRHLQTQYSIKQIPSGKEFINTVEILGSKSTVTPIVVIHGFASALATFVNMLRALSEHCPRVYAIDLLGFGRSSKPTFPVDDRACEALFVDSIEGWRVNMGFESMILCAHSFGAYIATQYAHKYPELKTKLILFEPWGFQTNANTTQWSFNPLWFLKMAGPLGLPLMKRFTYPLFNHTFSEIGTGDEMITYLYHSNVQCTGDAGFMALNTHSYLPKRPAIPAPNTTFIYGSDSWIEPLHADEIIPNAGHQIYADQPELFIAAVLRHISSNADLRAVV